MSSKVFVLPSKEEMLVGLLKIDDDQHVQSKFYPLLTKRAGEQKVASGLVLVIQLAIRDYTEGMPAMMGVVMNMRMSEYIDALCPDEEIAAEAKAIFEQANAAE